MPISSYWKAIILALQQNYRVDLDTGQIFGPKSELQIRKYPGQQYPTVRLYVEGLPESAYSVPAHKVVAYVKYGEVVFDKGIQVRHKDADVLNLTGDNILIGTSSQNQMDKCSKVRSTAAKKARAAQGRHGTYVKLTPAQIPEILAVLGANRVPSGRIRRGIVKDLSEQYGVSPSTISLIGKGNIWKK